MFGRAIVSFLMDNYGEDVWRRILASADISDDGVLSLARKSFLCRRLLIIAARELGVPRGEVLEDLGAWLVRQEPVPRLLRFIGNSYREFLDSCPDLPGQLGVLVPEISEVDISICETSGDSYRICLSSIPESWLGMVKGALRGAADGYGALIVLNCTHRCIDLSIFSDRKEMRSQM